VLEINPVYAKLGAAFFPRCKTTKTMCSEFSTTEDSSPASKSIVLARVLVPQPPERQRIGNEINAALIVAGADFVNVFFVGILQFSAAEVIESPREGRRGT
jgi:hypothetical protein